jgi:membrane protease YdiL (CAAX protease family)
MIEQAKQASGNQLASNVLTISIVLLAYMVIGQLPLMLAVRFSDAEAITLGEPSLQVYAQVFGKNTLLFYLLFPFLTAFIALIVCIKYIHKKSIHSFFTDRKKFDVKRFFHAFFVWGIVLTLFFSVSLFLSSDLTWNFNLESFFPLLAIAVIFIPIQTSFEEFFFRGYIFKLVKNPIQKSWLIVVFTGVIFGLMHGANPEIEVLGYGILIYYIVTGIFLGLLRLMDDGLELSMGYHAVNNLFAALIISNEWQAFQTDALFIDHAKPTFGWDALLTICFFQPLLLLYFAKKYKWSNWKDKLSA